MRWVSVITEVESPLQQYKLQASAPCHLLESQSRNDERNKLRSTGSGYWDVDGDGFGVEGTNECDKLAIQHKDPLKIDSIAEEERMGSYNDHTD